MHRFRGAFFGSELSAADAIAETMDTAGKAVLFSGATVLVSLCAVMLVPSPAFRSMALGIMLAVVFVLAATLTLLPAVLAKLGPRVDRLALPWAHSGEHRSPRFAAWAERLWRRPLVYGALALALLVALALPVLRLKTAMPSIKVVPDERLLPRRLRRSSRPRSGRARRPAADRRRRRAAAAVGHRLERDPGIAGSRPPRPTASLRAPHGDPDAGSLRPGGRADDRPAARAAPRRHAGRRRRRREPRPGRRAVDEDAARDRRRAGARLRAAAGGAPGAADRSRRRADEPARHRRGLRRGKLIFQDGALHSLLGFESQGFLDAWGPVFFFAMIFAISMDYTVFLLSSAKEHWDRTHDPREAMVGGLAHSGRVIFAAGAVMVAVFFTFALSGPLPPKEMGVILGIAVLLDAALIRLLLVPVLLRLMGRWAWYLPRWAHRMLPAVRFGHA